jgi:hypothetical protein
VNGPEAGQLHRPPFRAGRSRINDYLKTRPAWASATIGVSEAVFIDTELTLARESPAMIPRDGALTCHQIVWFWADRRGSL